MSLPEPADNARGPSPLGPDLEPRRGTAVAAVTAVTAARSPTSGTTHLALLIVQIAFAVGAVEGKLAMRPTSSGGEGLDPFALAMARMFGATVFFQVLMRATGKLRPLPRRDHLRIAGLSMLGIVLNQTLFLVGLKITTAFAAVLLGVTIPVFTAALAVAFRVERPSLRLALGLALAILGVLWLTGRGSLDWGALAIAANCLSYALYLVLSKDVIVRVGALPLVTWIFTWGAIMFAPLGAWPLVSGAATWGPRAWELVAVIVVMPTIVAYSANAWALGRSTPTLVSVYIYLQPLIAAALQWVQLGEPVSSRALVASGFIVAGVSVVATRRVRGD
ncbi:MAG TPA: DMT family transporter [Polyangiaceae bacterium]|jgi:drug/metabolite transporter (DMT)-like permease|nr:DMT family transporter [Polyangiaceae bacterium]